MSKTQLSRLMSKSIVEPALRQIPHTNMWLAQLLYNINHYKSAYCAKYTYQRHDDTFTVLRGDEVIVVGSIDKVCNFLRCLLYRLQNTNIGHAYY